MEENSLDIHIDRTNFREVRKMYDITLKDISNKCKLSMQTVSNYENYTGQYTQTRTRDYNNRTIIRALEDLIKQRIQEIFPCGHSIKEKEINENMETKTRKDRFIKGYYKDKVVVKLKEYCKANDISFTEFCSMCGVSYASLAPYAIKISPIAAEKVVSKICQAAGLELSSFDDCRNWGEMACSNSNNDSELTVVGDGSSINSENTCFNQHNDEPESTTDDLVQYHDNTDSVAFSEIKDKKYIFENGQYIEEYTVVKHVRRCITKEEFLEVIQKSSNKLPYEHI